jgi:hypothetical protein
MMQYWSCTVVAVHHNDSIGVEARAIEGVKQHAHSVVSVRHSRIVAWM